MKKTFLYLILLLPMNLTAQFQTWMPNTPLTDSSHNNRNACLFNVYPTRILFFDQEIDSATTQLCYRVISPALGDVTTALSLSGVKLTNPKVLEQYFSYLSTNIFYQSNEGADIDLKFFTFSNGTVSAPGTLAELPGDDINLTIGYSGVVAWENSGKIWVSHCSETGSFSPPFAVDSAGAFSPSFSNKLNYLKANGDSTLVVSAVVSYNQGNWLISDVVTNAFAGTSSSLVSTPLFYWMSPICFENKISSNPTGLILFNDPYSQTQYINSSIYNYTEPALIDFKIGVKSGLYFLSYVSDSLMQREIVTETPFGYPGVQNISQWPGEDRNPGFYESYGDTETIRVYLFWESERQGFSTIYSTYLEYPFGEIKDSPKAERLLASPCPFEQETTITLQAAMKSQFRILDLQGREIKSLSPQPTDSGGQKAIWNGTDYSGNSVPPGSYMVLARTQNETYSKIISKK